MLNALKTYRNTLRNHVYSARPMIGYMVGIAVILAFSIYIGYVNVEDRFLFVMMGVAGTLFFCAPAILLHLTYFAENRNTVLIVDHSNDWLEIKKGKLMYRYSIHDIESAHWIIGVYEDPSRRTMRPRVAPWSGYNYLNLVFKDGRSFIFTSLMINRHETPVTSFAAYFVLYPWPRKRKSIGEITEKRRREFEELVARFEVNYSDYSAEVLKAVIHQSKQYMPEAVQAAKNLLILKGHGRITK